MSSPNISTVTTEKKDINMSTGAKNLGLIQLSAKLLSATATSGPNLKTFPKLK
jgi:hypothetical protein